MTEVGSIEAVLSLNSSGFTDGLKTATSQLNKFANATQKLNEVNSAKAMLQLNDALTQLESSLQLVSGVSDKNLSIFSKLSNAINNMAKGLKTLQSDAINVDEAINTMNSIFKAFQGTLSSVEVKIKNVSSSLNQLTGAEKKQEEVGYNASKTFKMMQDGLLKWAVEINRTGDIVSKATAQEIYDLQRLQKELEKTQIVRRLSNSERTIKISQTHTNIDQATASLRANSQAMQENAVATLRNMGYKGKLATEEAQVRANSYSTTSALEKQSMAHNKASASANNQTTATNRLGRALSSLKMMGTMVASMLVYNFAHSLITATRETVNAKSEMEGYFKMLHFNQTEIGNFNKALDETVGKFQRINKYALGETISSIGVEFNLTTQEMEKAMPVVSMITSEYLRAGRNVNEASLAVKDILQGEFQRLSRETGVKGDQLKEAGWSGDKKDVMGLLEALDTVGKSRNWDIFVTKANSLNDAVLILQNRFSEWSADMVNVVQPTILNVFNTLMTVGGLLSGVFEGAWKWLSGEGIANDIVRWTGLATAITGVAGALIHYRTGANLVQIAQMGLRGSITATIFDLKAEEVATYGSRNAIVSKITSLKAEQVANLGVKNAIATKVLGLNAELVAQKGLKGAIMSSTYANQLAKASEEGANAERLKTIYLEQQEQLSKMGSIRAIFAKIAGVNMETFAEKGLTVALAERIAQSPLYVGSLEAEKVAELSTAEAGFILMGSLLPLTAILIGLAVAIYGLVKPLQDASEHMKQFNNLVNDGDNIIKSHKKTYDGLVESYNATNEELQGLEANSKKYLRVQDKLDALEKDKKTAYDNWQNSIKAVEMARSRQAKYDEEKSKIAIHNQTELADAYIKAGLSSKEAMELTSHEMAEAENGAEQLRKALQMIKFNADKSASKTTKMIEKLDAYGMSDERIKQFGRNMSEAQYKIAEGLDKFMTSDDLMERITGWLELQQGYLEEWWTEINAFFDMRDWDGVKEKLWEGFKHILDLTPLGQMLEDFYNGIQEQGIVGAITEALFGEGDSDGAWDIFAQFMDENVIQPVGSWLSWFFEDPSAHWDEVVGDMSTALAYLLFGKNANGKQLRDITQDWLDNVVIPAITDAIKDYFSVDNILKGGFTFGGVGALTSSLPKLLFGDDASINTLGEDITNYLNSIDWGKLLSDAFQTMIETISNIDFDLWGHILDLILPQGRFASDGSSDHPSFMEDVSNIIGIDIQTWINNFQTDPLGTLGIELPEFNIGDFIFSLFNNGGEGDATKTFDFSWIPQAIYDSISGAISEWTGSIDLVEFVTNLIPSNNEGIYQWAMDNIITPLVDGIKQGVLNTPVLGNVASLLGFGDDAETESQESGQTVGTGFTTGVQTGLAPLDGVINTAFQGLNLDEVTANFTNNSANMTTTATSTATSVASSYATMKNNQKSSLDSMVANNTNSFRDMHDKSHTQMLAMRDSTSNVTHQMTDAWSLMKDKIIDSAKKIRDDSKTRFDDLGSVIGSFYRKIQNPSQWGGGSAGSPTVRSGSRNPSLGRSVAHALKPRGYAGGLSNGSYGRNTTMSIGALKKEICPTGNCDIFDGYSSTDIVNVGDFLSSISGKHGLGGWNFASTHNAYIKKKSDAWDTAPPIIQLLGGIATSTKFKVGEFNDGTPKVSFSEFQDIAQAIFSRIPYRLYFDSSWKGSWLGALQAGACNCYDGALALMALASTFGFSASMGHGSWTDPDGKKTAHVWAIINGVKMDTTGMQQRGTWNPSSSAGGSPTGSGGSGKTVNINVEISGTVYGVEDLDSRIQESVQKGLQAEFNDPYTVSI